MLPMILSSLPAMKPSRRGFLLGVATIGGALVIGSHAGPALADDPSPPFAVIPPKVVSPLDAHLKIDKDGTVTILSAQFDMGQSAYHGAATLVAEELDFDWSKLKVEGAFGPPELYGNLAQGGVFQLTGGSSGMSSSFMRYRQAGALAREMLIAAAAKAWSMPAADIRIEKGMMLAKDKSESIGAFAEAAAAMPVPVTVALKDAKDWKVIGNDAIRTYDARKKVTGQAPFTIDVKLDGMLTAVPVHPPMFGATVKSFDASKAKAVKGVVDVVPMPSGLAVVAEHMWAAIKGREALTVEWDDAKAEKRSSEQMTTDYKALLAKPAAATARSEGDVDAALKSAAKTLEATYEFPYLAHAALEPLNAVARFNADGTLEIWGGHQIPGVHQAVAAQVGGVAPEKVVLHVLKTGGGFGRRATASGDIIQEVVAVAKAVGKPVKMQWTREDDMRAGFYRPMYMHGMKAALDKDGNLTAWQHHIVGQSIGKGTMFEGFIIKNGVDMTSVEGAYNLPYALANQKIELTTADSAVPVLWWRAVGSTHNAYAAETFLDEVAEAAGKDPVDFRMGMLKDKPRHAAVLKLAAEKAGWGTPLPDGRYRGVALAESFYTIVAQVAEISMTDGRPKVERVVCALDCGVAVNPDQIRAQIEGGIGFGLGAILKSRLTLDGGKIVEGNFDGYEVLNISEMPQVEVHIVKSDLHPTGVGEPGVPPIGPAVANAFYQATKRRVRQLPFSRPENA